MGKLLCIDIRMAPTLRLGITASSRFGNAPERNRFKRLVREVFRRNAADLPLFEIHVVPRQKAKKASYQAVCDEMLRLLCHS